MKPTVYTVRACRWGDTETHSYIVGVYPQKHAALKAAETEEEYRGGKYECEVLEWQLGEGRECRHFEPKTIKGLRVGGPLTMRHVPQYRARCIICGEKARRSYCDYHLRTLRGVYIPPPTGVYMTKERRDD